MSSQAAPVRGQRAGKQALRPGQRRNRRRSRRAALLPALQSFGFTVTGSEAGLYLWASDGSDTWDALARFADRGIVVGPGTFYGEAGNGFVRVALTGTDERINAAVERLRGAL